MGMDTYNIMVRHSSRVLVTNYRLINCPEFLTFIRHTEKQLRKLFRSIDMDHNDKVSKEELDNAFRNAGIPVPSSKLDQFFSQVDSNKDGVITFDEWR